MSDFAIESTDFVTESSLYVILNSFFIIYKGGKGIGTDDIELWMAVVISFSIGIGVALLMIPVIPHLKKCVKKRFDKLQEEKMNKIIYIDDESMTITSETGVILSNIHEEVEKKGLFFPLSLGAKGSCTIGGNLSTNAGGINVLKYGNTRDLCLGLEIVLPNGEIMDLLKMEIIWEKVIIINQ